MKTIKFYLLSKRNSLAELILSFKTSLPGLMSKLSLTSRVYLRFSYATSSKDGILLQIRRWSQVALSFNGFSFVNVKGDILIYSSDLTFKCLSVSP